MSSSPDENKGKIDLIVKSIETLTGAVNDFKKDFYEAMKSQNKDFLNEIRLHRQEVNVKVEKNEKRIEKLDTRFDGFVTQYGKDKAYILGASAVIAFIIGLGIKMFI